jgi:prepilin-type N-terminal cleavage/methylation domain-containing protein
MTGARRAQARGQAGFTLVELIITMALSVLLLTALTSVMLTAWRANDVATSRVEASSQIRSFQAYAYDDFALSNVSNLSGCTPSTPCTTPITLSGTQASNSFPPVTNPSYQVVYSWDQANGFIQRQVGNNPPVHAAVDVASFSWFVDTNSTVVVSVTVTVSAYSESQTFRFHPRLNP